MKDNALSFTEGLQQSLTSYWNNFILSFPKIFFAIFIFVIFYLIAINISKVIKYKFVSETSDPLFVRFLSKTVKYLLIIVGIIFAMQALGFSGVAQGILAGAGISAFIFGFAFKDIAENFLGGLILAFNRPFALNDTIMIREFSGHVKALNFRTTHIKTFDEKDVFIPNSIVIKEPLINFTRDGKIRLDFMVGIDYDDNIDKAIETIIRAIEPIEDLKNNRKPFAVVEELATSTVNLRVYFWSDTLDYKKGVLQIKSDVITKVKEILVAEGFSMPSDIQELKIYGKQPLPINILNLENTSKITDKLS